MKKWLKADLHTHNWNDPDDGRSFVAYSPEALIDRASSLGYEVLAMTNHNQLDFSPRLQDYACRQNIVLIPGVEATIRGRHILLYNFLDYDPSWRDPETIRSSKGSEQLVIAPHPFYPIFSSLRGLFFHWVDLFDAVEYNHFYTVGLNFNRRAQKVAQRSGLPMVGNSDAHLIEQLGITYSLIEAEKTPGSIIRAVKKGRVKVVTSPAPIALLIRWLWKACTSPFSRAILPQPNTEAT